MEPSSKVSVVRRVLLRKRTLRWDDAVGGKYGVKKSAEKKTRNSALVEEEKNEK